VAAPGGAAMARSRWIWAPPTQCHSRQTESCLHVLAGRCTTRGYARLPEHCSSRCGGTLPFANVWVVRVGLQAGHAVAAGYPSVTQEARVPPAAEPELQEALSLLLGQQSVINLRAFRCSNAGTPPAAPMLSTT
jgi:hypothetical protein